MQNRIFLATMGFALAALLASCGGTGVRTGGPDSGNAGSTGGMVDAGGMGGQTGQGGSGGAGQDGHDSTADAPKAPDAGRDAMLAPDSFCETLRLELAVTSGFCTSGPTCRCYLTDDQQESIGTLSLDADGRVVDNSRMSGQEETQWLDGLGSLRWPCLAGRTILYSCRFAG